MQQPLQPNGHENHGPKSKRHSKSAPKADPHSEKTRVSAGNPPLEGDKPTVIWAHPEIAKTQIIGEGYQHIVKGARKGEKVEEIIELAPEDLVTSLTQTVQQDVEKSMARPIHFEETPSIEISEEESSELTGDQWQSKRELKEMRAAESQQNPESIEVDVSEFDQSSSEMIEAPEIEEITLEAFLTKEKLDEADAYVLYELFKNDRKNPDIWAFIERIAPKPADFELFKHNINLLSPQFIHALLAVGSYRQHYFDEKRQYQNSIFLLMGTQLNKGGLGQVSSTLYAFEHDLKLKPALVKTSLEAPEAQAVFQDEIVVARQIKHLLENNAEDPRTAHILPPIHVGENFILMPKVSNQEGQVLSLNELKKYENKDVRHWAGIMKGAMEGNTFLAENGFINHDFKPANILEGKQGGVLIDWGGIFNKKAMMAEGKVEVLGHIEQGSMYPLVQNAVLSLNSEEGWEKNKGNIPNTPGYFSVHLMSMELLDQMPAGTTHKFQLYRIIDRYFQERYPQLRNGSRFQKMGEIDKLYAEPLELGDLQLNQGEQLLYELYLKLHQAHFHPYRFEGDNIKNGIDPKFISNGEIIARLEEIANLPTL
jgi:hypothetical protein